MIQINVRLSCISFFSFFRVVLRSFPPPPLHIETVRVGYAREARQKTMSELTEENRRLRAALGHASAPERVTDVAQSKGLRPPHPGQVQYIEAPAAPPAPSTSEAPSR